MMLTRRSVRADLWSVGTRLVRGSRTMMILSGRPDSHIEITAAMCIISHPVMADAIMSVVHIMAVTVTIMSLIIADIVKMSTIMPSAIAGVMMRFSIIEEVHIIIYQINTELPFILMRVNGTVEMLGSHKAAIMHAGE